MDLITLKVCLTASITVFCADIDGSVNQCILPNFWRVRFLDFPLHQTRRIHFVLLASYITRHSPKEKPASCRTRKSSLTISLASTRIISVIGESAGEKILSYVCGTGNFLAIGFYEFPNFSWPSALYDLTSATPFLYFDLLEP